MKSLHISLTMLIWRLKLWTISNNYKNRLDFFPGFYLVSLWYACVMVLNFAYSSNLRAFIVMPDPGRLIDSDTDVLKSNARVFYPGYSDQVELWKNRTRYQRNKLLPISEECFWLQHCFAICIWSPLWISYVLWSNLHFRFEDDLVHRFHLSFPPGLIDKLEVVQLHCLMTLMSTTSPEKLKTR